MSKGFSFFGLKTELNLIDLNIQALTNKLTEFEAFLMECKPDIVCLNEHWMNVDFSLNVNFCGYKCAAKYCRSKYKGGGVIIYTKDYLETQDLKILSTVNSIEKCFEYTGCKIIHKNKSIIVVNIYRSPSGDWNTFISQLNLLLNGIITRNQQIIVCGDLNVNQLYDSLQKNVLFDLMNSFQLDITTCEPTRITNTSKTAIDYIFTNISKQSYCTSVFDPGLSDHSALQFNLTCFFNSSDRCNANSVCKFVRSYSDENIDYFNYLLNLCSWHHLTCFNDINSMFNFFMEHLLWSFSSSFCFKKVSSKLQTNNWANQNIKKNGNMMRCLNVLRKKYANNQLLNELYKKYKIYYKNNIKEAKTCYYFNQIQTATNRNKTTWNIVNKTLGRHTKGDETISLCYNDQDVNEPKSVADIFAEYFSTIAEKKLNDRYNNITSNNCTVNPLTVSNSLFFDYVSEQEISTIIDSLNNKKSTGFDEISSWLLKRCKISLLYPLTNIINYSIKSGQFPDSLKTALVKPLYKKDDHKSVNNYRPISLLSTLSKVFERVIFNRIMNFLIKYNILCPNQHGFLHNKSTLTATVHIVEKIYKAIDKKMYVVGIFFDLAKAFDSVSTEFLIDKLYTVGIRGNALQLIQSYLTDRNLIVKISTEFSEKKDINIGVPQGSVLGPLLFLIFINDLPYFIKEGDVVMFADDTSILVSAESSIQLQAKIKTVLSDFSTWCQKNKLVINENKTQIISFGNKTELNLDLKINDHVLSLVNNVKYLGLYIDKKLKWSDHINYICKKLNSSYFAIKVLKSFVNKEVLLQVYYSLVYSNIKYNIIIWGQSSDIRRLFILQKRIIRLIFNLKPMETCRSTFIQNNILTVPSIYMMECILQIKSHITAHTKVNDIHNHDIRTSNEIRLSKCRLKMSQKNPNYFGSVLFNKLPSNLTDIKCCKQFKTRLKSFFIKICFYDIKDFLNYNFNM